VRRARWRQGQARLPARAAPLDRHDGSLLRSSSFTLLCAFPLDADLATRQETGLARCVLVDEGPAMRGSLFIAACRVLTWCCVFLLAVLSLMPAQDMVRTGVPGELEHLVAYAGSAAIGMAGYGPSRGGVR
jgi:hypothetical protein